MGAVSSLFSSTIGQVLGTVAAVTGLSALTNSIFGGDEGGGDSAPAPVAAPEVLQASAPSATTAPVTPESNSATAAPAIASESRVATISGAEDENQKKRKAAALGRSSLVTPLAAPTGLGGAVASPAGVGVGVGL